MNRRSLVSIGAIAATMLLPLVSQAGLVTRPQAFRIHPPHSNAAPKIAAGAATQIANLAEVYGFWRSTQTVEDSGATVSNTLELWIGSDGKSEMRLSLTSTDSEYPDEAFTMRMQVKSTWEVVGANILQTSDYCVLSSTLLGTNDCKSDEPDTAALADIEVKTVNGKKAMITRDTAQGGTTDTLYYVGATAAFTLGPVTGIQTRFEAADRARRRRSLAIFGDGYAVPAPQGLIDLRGRTGPDANPGQGIYFFRRP